ncbi:MAG TPA: hypothetical protein VK176_04670, partial [Phycisphaerales bacterium]|nr:hypothetical protein [Phycisphaerales bacterium]
VHTITFPARDVRTVPDPGGPPAGAVVRMPAHTRPIWPIPRMAMFGVREGVFEVEVESGMGRADWADVRRRTAI